MVGAVALSGCGDRTYRDAQLDAADSETHWMQPCAQDNDCGEALTCVCGLCTTACDQDSGCGMLNEVACAEVLDTPSCTEGQPAEAVCWPGCAEDSQCASLGQGATCDEGGLCRLPAPTPVVNNDPEEDPDPTERGNTMVVDPSTLRFFALPVGSIRGAVSGYAPEQDACVIAVWLYAYVPGIDNSSATRCAHDEFEPDIIVVPNPPDPANCDQHWELASNVEPIEPIDGCMGWTELGSRFDYVDLEMKVSGDAFEGRIVMSNHGVDGLNPVVVGVEVSEDFEFVEAFLRYNVGCQSEGMGWLRLFRDGEPMITDRDQGPCDGECAFVPDSYFDINTTRRAYYTLWSGRIQDSDCNNVPMSGEGWSARWCYGHDIRELDESSVEVINPMCEEVPFELPLRRLIFQIL